MTTYTLFADDPAPGGAPAGPGGPAGPPGMMGNPLFPLFIVGLFVLFYLVFLLPMNRRQKKEQEQLLSNLKRGAKVITSGGIVATIVSAKDGEDEVVIRSEDTRLRVKRNVIVQIVGTDEAEAAKS